MFDRLVPVGDGFVIGCPPECEGDCSNLACHTRCPSMSVSDLDVEELEALARQYLPPSAFPLPAFAGVREAARRRRVASRVAGGLTRRLRRLARRP